MNKEKNDLETKTCDQCGRPAVIEVNGKWLCEECYQEYGSCCLEFGEKDLWTDPEKEDK